MKGEQGEASLQEEEKTQTTQGISLRIALQEHSVLLEKELVLGQEQSFAIEFIQAWLRS